MYFDIYIEFMIEYKDERMSYWYWMENILYIKMNECM